MAEETKPTAEEKETEKEKASPAEALRKRKADEKAEHLKHDQDKALLHYRETGEVGHYVDPTKDETFDVYPVGSPAFDLTSTNSSDPNVSVELAAGRPDLRGNESVNVDNAEDAKKKD